MDKTKRIKQLTKLLNEYRDVYYNRGESIISDYDYDNLFDELQKLEEETGIILSNSPTQTVGYEVKSQLEKVKHSHPMLSLGKTKSVNDLIKFSNGKDCIISLKMDGLTVLNTYDNGELIQSETRGDGEEGELITHNAKVFDNLPLQINNTHRFEIEGEAIITKNDFELINSKLSEENKYKNPRNLASGSVRQLDNKIAKERHVKFVAWKIPFGFTYFTEGFNFAQSIGFEVVPYVTYNSKTDDIDKKIEELKSIAKEKSYPIDGLVITYDDKALKIRHQRLRGVSSDVAPILWQNGAYARLGKGETIDKLLFGGYSTLSLGYAGLYECVKYMTGHSHSDEGIGEKFGLEVMQALNDKCEQWRKEENIDYSLYGTPLEATTEKFANKLKERFGVIEGITDRNYVTNSYHIPVFEKIDAFEKLRIEAKFQKLSPGGSISYIECPNMENNIPAILEVIKFIYNNNMYAELNTKSDYCQNCGWDKEINLIDEDGKLIWECPNCGNRDVRTMDITRRTCGYKGTARNGWNQGRLGDIHDRIEHLDDLEYEENN